MNAVLVTAPAAEPLSTAEAKTHLRVSGSSEDSYIAGLVTAARMRLERMTGRALITQTWDLFCDEFPRCGSIAIPKGRLQSISSLKYTDADGVETPWDATNYLAVIWEDPSRLTLNYGASWPSVTLKAAGGIIVRFVAGYGDAASDVPEDFRHAMKLLIGRWFEHREDVAIGPGAPATVPEAVRALIAPYAIGSV